MSDPLFAPLPDAVAYLRRIGIQEDPASLKCDLATLNHLILMHQTHVPFENLDLCMLKVPINLEIPALFDKIVTRHRGGYCFELNALFTELLRALGFETRSVIARIVIGHPDSEVRPGLHRGTLVRLDGTWHFCDVGFGGPMPAGAVPVVDGFEGMIQGEHFYMEKMNYFSGISDGTSLPEDDPYLWWRVSRDFENPDAPNGQPQKSKVQEFNLFPQNNKDFLPANMWCTSDMSVFNKSMMVNLRTATGHYSITADQFTIEDGGTKNTRTLTDLSDVKRVLGEYFSLYI